MFCCAWKPDIGEERVVRQVKSTMQSDGAAEENAHKIFRPCHPAKVGPVHFKFKPANFGVLKKFISKKAQ